MTSRPTQRARARKRPSPRNDSRQRPPAFSPLSPTREICLELTDYSETTTSAIRFFGCKDASDSAGQAARLTDQFIRQNRTNLNLLDVSIQRDFDGSDVLLRIQSGSAVGAIPLISPLTARNDFGLVIQPRFPWKGIGPMLADMGWLIHPTPLRLPLLKRSERRVPPWVLSLMVLSRLQHLLARLDRRFEFSREVLSAPRGTIDWNLYATHKLPRGLFLDVPCTFPDLRDDRRLRSAIRFALERQRSSLQTQSSHGAFVHRLICLAEAMLTQLRDVPAIRPGPNDILSWFRKPLRNSGFLDGVQAIDWTIEERGLAGRSDLEGIPWTLPMEQFFEAWVETILRLVARQTGATLRSARLRETVAPIGWDPPYTGSQRSLIPDLVLEAGSTTFIFDAKYKRHWEELHQGRWSDPNAGFQESHRADLLQVLAYANLARSSHTICCLVYPCSLEIWNQLTASGRFIHRAEIPNFSRKVEVWLTALPMGAELPVAAAPLADHLLRAGNPA